MTSVTYAEDKINNNLEALLTYEDGSTITLPTETSVEVISTSRSGTIYQATVRTLREYSNDLKPSVATIGGQTVSGDLVIVWTNYGGNSNELLYISGQWKCNNAIWSEISVTGYTNKANGTNSTVFATKSTNSNIFAYTPTALGIPSNGNSFQAFSKALGKVGTASAWVQFSVST